jgi:isopenicillin N synthase-like dioxygenase
VKTDAGQTDHRYAGRLMQDEASLISIDEYAAREGVSAELIKACGEAGIVQIRRHKGKTYVVDRPLTPYFQAEACDGRQQDHHQLTKAIRQRRTDASKTGKNISPNISNRTIPAGSITNLAQKMFLKAHPLTGKPLEPIEQLTGGPVAD